MTFTGTPQRPRQALLQTVHLLHPLPHQLVPASQYITQSPALFSLRRDNRYIKQLHRNATAPRASNPSVFASWPHALANARTLFGCATCSAIELVRTRATNPRSYPRSAHTPPTSPPGQPTTSITPLSCRRVLKRFTGPAATETSNCRLPTSIPATTFCTSPATVSFAFLRHHVIMGLSSTLVIRGRSPRICSERQTWA